MKEKIMILGLILLLLASAQAYINFPNTVPANGAYTNEPKQVITVDINSSAPINESSIKFELQGVPHDLTDSKLKFNSSTGKLSYTTLTEFTDQREQRVKLTAQNNVGENGLVEFAFTLDLIPSEPITNLEGDFNADQNVVMLNWTKPASTGAEVVSYKIFRSTMTITERTKKEDLLKSNVLDLNYVDGNVRANTRYNYKVAAVDQAGNESDLSNNKSIKTGNFEDSGDSDQNNGGDIDQDDDQPSTGKLGELVEVEFLHDEVYVGRGSSMNLNLVMNNLEDREVCVEVKANLEHDEDYDYLNIKIPESLTDRYGDRFNSTSIGRAGVFNEGRQVYCLNPNEQTFFSLTVEVSDDAEDDYYDVELVLEAEEFSLSREIRLEVLSDGEQENIDFPDAGSTVFVVCRENYENEIEVEVENESGDEDNVRLFAESEIFAPTFEPNKLDLEGNDSRFVKLKIHTNESTRPGLHEIPVSARTEDWAYLIKRTLLVEVRDCGEQGFFLTASTAGKTIRPGEEAEIQFILSNRSNKEQVMKIVEESDLETHLLNNSIVLPANSTVSGKLLVKGRAMDKSGEHIVSIYASNQEGDYRKIDVTVFVEGETGFEVNVFEGKEESRQTDQMIKRYPFLPQKVRQEVEEPRKRSEREEKATGFFGLPTDTGGFGILALALIVLVVLGYSLLKQGGGEEFAKSWARRHKVRARHNPELMNEYRRV